MLLREFNLAGWVGHSYADLPRRYKIFFLCKSLYFVFPPKKTFPQVPRLVGGDDNILQYMYFRRKSMTKWIKIYMNCVDVLSMIDYIVVDEKWRGKDLFLDTFDISFLYNALQIQPQILVKITLNSYAAELQKNNIFFFLLQ